MNFMAHFELRCDLWRESRKKIGINLLRLFPVLGGYLKVYFMVSLFVNGKQLLTILPLLLHAVL